MGHLLRGCQNWFFFFFFFKNGVISKLQKGCSGWEQVAKRVNLERASWKKGSVWPIVPIINCYWLIFASLLDVKKYQAFNHVELFLNRKQIPKPKNVASICLSCMSFHLYHQGLLASEMKSLIHSESWCIMGNYPTSRYLQIWLWNGFSTDSL